VSDAPTYAACLTPPGVAALAVLALRGPHAWQIARSLFQPRGQTAHLPDEPQPGQFWLGRFGDEIADEAVLAVKQASPMPRLEIHSHGGREVVRLLLETLEAHGARICSWQELDYSTTDDPLRIEALAALPDAKTIRTAAILLDQVNGALHRALDAVLDDARKDNLEAAAGKLAELDRYSGVGRHLTAPWRVVIAGAPNVGKSSLINALAGYQRCIVAPTPGTTRDVVTTLVAFHGWPVELADTAGLRSHADMLEAAGIRMAQHAASAAELCLWVLDASAPPVWPEALSGLGAVKFVVNKADLAPVWDVAEAQGAPVVSALTGAGVPELCKAIADWLVPEAPPPGQGIPFTAELCDQIDEAAKFARAGDPLRLAAALGAARGPKRCPEEGGR
jgi:tRNA modification GTPase